MPIPAFSRFHRCWDWHPSLQIFNEPIFRFEAAQDSCALRATADNTPHGDEMLLLHCLDAIPECPITATAAILADRAAALLRQWHSRSRQPPVRYQHAVPP